MNKTALKKFAAQAREKIRTGIEQKAYELGITAKQIQELQVLPDGLIIGDRVLGEREAWQYQHLKRRIEQEGFHAIIDEATYTWFNRIIALRFMEVNDYLPIHCRVLSSLVPGKTEPDILTNILQYTDALQLDKELVYHLREENCNEDLYRYLLVEQCNRLGEIIPTVFESISDDMALLLPDGLLQEGSPIRDIVEMLEEEEWKNVEILGWLYQFYIADRKDAVFANLKKNKKIGKADIPAATQLFTPRWIVEYMVDNSLGRLWLESYPDQEFQESLTYYLEDAEQEPEVQAQLEALKNPDLDVEQIRFLDPCCGSGHILVYAFEVFYKMYQTRGYSRREIPKLILEKNLFGLEIDRRAAQLATFAVIMKAREYDARLFNRTYRVNVCSIEESNEIPKEHLQLFAQHDPELLQAVSQLTATFRDAKIYGSILQVPEIPVQLVQQRINYFLSEGELDIFTGEMMEYSLPILQSLVTQYYLLAMQYEVVVTNPPYMGGRGMDQKLKKFLDEHYKDYSGDLFSTFIYRNTLFTKLKGYTGFMTPFVWMFIKNYEKLRKFIIAEKNIDSLVHLEYSAFEEATVPICTFVLRNYPIDSKGVYIDLSSFKGGMRIQRKEYLAIQKHLNSKYRYEVPLDSFSNISGTPVAYWVSDNFQQAFSHKKIKDFSTVITGMTTGNNNKYLRLWYEINNKRIDFKAKEMIKENLKRKYWFPYSKGGPRRNWYGNYEYVINWRMKDNFNRSKTTLQQLYFRDGVTWPFITSGTFSARYLPEGFLWDVAGSPCFFEILENKWYVLGFLASKVANLYLKIMNPTLNVQANDIEGLPLIYVNKKKNQIIDIVKKNVEISKKDWDSFETSWDFKKHPFLEFPGNSIAESYQQWEEFAEGQFNQLKQNEEELNRIFIEIYGLQEELSPEVADKDVTVRKADYERDVRSFLSYLAGIIFGRYSLDEEGLVFAGGEWDQASYAAYQPVRDNILPITEDGFFGEDLVKKVTELVELIYGKENSGENLRFIAKALGKKNDESSTETIRRYFRKEFYKDHVKIYQKRPIYWLFTSGKRGAFQALVYLHRYDRDTVARIRTDYVLPLFMTLDNLIVLEQQIIDSPDASNQAKAQARKKLDNYQKDKEELSQYSEVLDHIAKQRIELDLDDGVKVNYAKFQDIEVAAEVTSKKTRVNLLEKI